MAKKKRKKKFRRADKSFSSPAAQLLKLWVGTPCGAAYPNVRVVKYCHQEKIYEHTGAKLNGKSNVS